MLIEMYKLLDALLLIKTIVKISFQENHLFNGKRLTYSSIIIRWIQQHLLKFAKAHRWREINLLKNSWKKRKSNCSLRDFRSIVQDSRWLRKCWVKIKRITQNVKIYGNWNESVTFLDLNRQWRKYQVFKMMIEIFYTILIFVDFLFPVTFMFG